MVRCNRLESTSGLTPIIYISSIEVRITLSINIYRRIFAGSYWWVTQHTINFPSTIRTKEGLVFFRQVEMIEQT